MPSIDLLSPAGERSGSENYRRAAPNEGLQPQASGSSGQSRRRRDDGLWPVDEESAFIELLKQEKMARLAGDVMVTGEVRFTRMTLQLNQQFHDKHPQQYKKKEWKQIRSKEQNLRALCKDVLGKIYGATKAKTVRTSVATLSCRKR